MNEDSAELHGIIRKNTEKLQRIYASLEGVYSDELPLVGKTDRSALMVAGLLENYYTCLETIFVRISQFFENNLAPQRWHSELLEKMTIELEGKRIAVVSDENYSRLLELLKFRHFRRYYFELEYDWDRLEFLRKKLQQAHAVVIEDLAKFNRFLKQISGDHRSELSM